MAKIKATNVQALAVRKMEFDVPCRIKYTAFCIRLIIIRLFLNNFLKLEPQLLAQIKNKDIDKIGRTVFHTIELVPSQDFRKN